MKKTLIRLSVLAILIISCISFSSVSATAELDDLSLVLEVPQTAVNANGTFLATVKVANSNVSKFNIAGIQVSLAYNSSKLTAVQANNQMGSGSLVASNIVGSTVKFVAVKDDFATNGCYTALGTDGVLFTVQFRANENIDDPTTLFAKDGLTFIFGDTDALAVEAKSVYGGNIAKLTEAILNTDMQVVANATSSVNVVVVALTNSTITSSDIMDKFDDAQKAKVTITEAVAGSVGTGSVIRYEVEDGVFEEVEVAIQGDIDGDSVSDVFDANIAAKGTALSGAREYIKQQDGAESILKHATTGSFSAK